MWIDKSLIAGTLAAQRIARIESIVQRLEAHRAGVHHQQPPDQPLAEADDLADDFQRHHRAEHTHERTENAGLGAGRHRAGRRRLGKQAAVGRIGPAVFAALVRANGGERAVEGADRRRDQRLFREIARIRNEIARGEIIRAVGDDVVLRDQRQRVARGQALGVDRDLHMRVEPRDRRGGAVDLGWPTSGVPWITWRCKFDSATRVVVDHAEQAYSGRRQIQQHRRAQSAGADHQHAGAAERRLAGAADLAQHDVPGIAFELFRRQHVSLQASKVAHRRHFG